MPGWYRKTPRYRDGEGRQGAQSTARNQRLDERAGHHARPSPSAPRPEAVGMSLAISGPETMASTVLLPSTKDRGAIDPFERHMRGRHAAQIVVRSGRFLRRRYSGLPATINGNGGVSRTATMSAAITGRA